jgi:hypothetical protein
MNYAQKYVEYVSRHPRKIILKSRQQGISTYYLMKNLDKCLTEPGTQAGIQSYGLDESAKLQGRVKVMLDNLDKDIMYKVFGVRIVRNNTKAIEFSNGSILKIGNFRGDTLQSYHVSEYAKISKNSPEKANEIKTGAFQAIAKGNAITVESTAEGASGNFYDLWQTSVRKLLTNTLTQLDFYPVFLSWLVDPDCTLDDPNADISQDALDYVKRLREKLPNVELTKYQMQWLTSKLDELGDDFDREYPATPELAFRQSIEGTYFRHQYNVMLRKGLIGKYYYDPHHPVDCSYDLGINDEFVVLFSQNIDNVPRIIDEFHITGASIEDIVKMLIDKQDTLGYKYRMHYFPHDVRNRELTTGISRLEMFVRLGVKKYTVVPKLSFPDSIQAARTMMVRCRVSDKCNNTLNAIQNYRKQYDKQAGAYKTTDVHDIHSNYMAAFRYLATGYGYHKIMQKPQKIETRNIRHNSGFNIL